MRGDGWKRKTDVWENKHTSHRGFSHKLAPEEAVLEPAKTHRPRASRVVYCPQCMVRILIRRSSKTHERGASMFAETLEGTAVCRPLGRIAVASVLGTRRSVSARAQQRISNSIGNWMRSGLVRLTATSR